MLSHKRFDATKFDRFDATDVFFHPSHAHVYVRTGIRYDVLMGMPAGSSGYM